MRPSEIRLLKLLAEGRDDKNQLMNLLHLKEQQFNYITKELSKNDYINIMNHKLSFRQNAKSILLRDIIRQYDIEKLLPPTTEIVYYLLTKPVTFDELIKESGLSISTMNRVLSNLESIGAVVKQEDGKISIDPTKEKLLLYAQLINAESDKGMMEHTSQVIYQNRSRILKKVPRGNTTKGELTGFSVFTEYGIDYFTAYDYYAIQSSALTLEEVLIDAILIASRDNDKNAMAIALLFYIKNKHKFDILRIRRIARECGISEIWLDAEGYIRNNEVKNKDLFLSSSEFEEKAKLYEIHPDLYVLPPAYPTLFESLGQKIESHTKAFLIGGENMRIKNLKDRTKDCDIVVKNQASLRVLTEALKVLGYKSINETNLPREDKRVNASDILIHEGRSRIDIFVDVIGRKLHLSSAMMNRCEIKKFDKLDLGILQNEDVFLLKAVTNREGDVHDMAAIVQAGKFDWEKVWDELESQHSSSEDINLHGQVLNQIDDLFTQTHIRPPFYRKLVRRAIDKEIELSVRREGKWLDDIVLSLHNKGFNEMMIRNRIGFLIKKKRIRKIPNPNGRMYISIRTAGSLSTRNVAPKSVQQTIEDYIHSFSIRLQISMKVDRIAIEAVGRVIKNPTFIGFRPRNLAAAILYLIAKRNGLNISAENISSVARVSKPSIYSRAKDIAKILQ